MRNIPFFGSTNWRTRPESISTYLQPVSLFPSGVVARPYTEEAVWELGLD